MTYVIYFHFCTWVVKFNKQKLSSVNVKTKQLYKMKTKNLQQKCILITYKPIML